MVLRNTVGLCREGRRTRSVRVGKCYGYENDRPNVHGSLDASRSGEDAAAVTQRRTRQARAPWTWGYVLGSSRTMVMARVVARTTG
jgi:hypothetical protein